MKKLICFLLIIQICFSKYEDHKDFGFINLDNLTFLMKKHHQDYPLSRSAFREIIATLFLNHIVKGYHN
jgi:hypothetical protein